MTQVKQNTLYQRLAKGMTVQEALSVPRFCDLSASDVELLNKNLIIKFTKPILTVKAKMQPSLQKEYYAVAHFLPSFDKHNARWFYTIMLADNKPLIVYAGEFEPLRIAQDQREISSKKKDIAVLNIEERKMMSWLRKANISACSAL